MDPDSSSGRERRRLLGCFAGLEGVVAAANSSALLACHTQKPCGVAERHGCPWQPGERLLGPACNQLPSRVVLASTRSGVATLRATTGPDPALRAWQQR